MILAGDVGGTKTVLALYETPAGGLELVRDAAFPSREHGSLDSILALFLAGDEPIEAAGFGVAGPILDGRVQTTNLPWQIDEAELAGRFGRAVLVNDLEAMAHGILSLPPERLAVLQRGSEPGRRGNLAVIAAGTGLGEALLYWDGERHRGVASEGGHGDFAPRSDEEIELLRFLRAELDGRVSVERVLSGPGLYRLYRFLRSVASEAEPPWLAERLRAEDPPSVVGEVGLAGSDPVCARSLLRFAEIYGAEAGDLALRYLAVGGVLLGGGIAPKILPALRGAAFTRAFADKGRFRPLLEGIEVSVALDPRAPLRGAAVLAQRGDGR